MTKQQQIEMSKQLLSDMMTAALNAKTPGEQQSIINTANKIQESIKKLEEEIAKENKPKNTFKQDMFLKILTDNIVYEIAGQENDMADGFITEEEFEEFKTTDNLMELATSLINAAYKDGHFESVQSEQCIEAKHIKFMGNEKIDTYKQVAIVNAQRKF